MSRASARVAHRSRSAQRNLSLPADRITPYTFRADRHRLADLDVLRSTGRTGVVVEGRRRLVRVYSQDRVRPSPSPARGLRLRRGADRGPLQPAPAPRSDGNKAAQSVRRARHPNGRSRLTACPAGRGASGGCFRSRPEGTGKAKACMRSVGGPPCSVASRNSAVISSTLGREAVMRLTGTSRISRSAAWWHPRRWVWSRGGLLRGWAAVPLVGVVLGGHGCRPWSGLGCEL